MQVSEDFPEEVFVRVDLSKEMFGDGFELRHRHAALFLGAQFEDLAPEHQSRRRKPFADETLRKGMGENRVGHVCVQPCPYPILKHPFT